MARNDARTAILGIPTDPTKKPSRVGMVEAFEDLWDTYEDIIDAASLVGRIRLSADTNFYVRTDGSDSNNGLADTAGGAFLTIQAAYNHLRKFYDLAGYFANVYVRAGTYTAGIIASGPAYSGPANAGTGIRFIGDTTTPANVKIHVASGRCIWATYGANLIFNGFELISDNDSLIYASASGSVTLQGNMTFGDCTGAHLWANVNGTVVLDMSAYTINGDANYHMFAYGNGVIENGIPSVTLTGTPTIGDYASASAGGQIFAQGTTFTGSMTGRKFYAGPLGSIITSSGNVNYFPGGTAGVEHAKGYYS